MKLILSILLTVLLAFFLYPLGSLNSVVKAQTIPSNTVIYNDSLNPSWQNWSWSSSINFAETQHINSGSKSINFSANPWGAFYLHTENSVDPNMFESIKFSIKGTREGQAYKVLLFNAQNQAMNSLPLNNFGGNITSGYWKSYIVPMRDINPSLMPFKGIAIQEAEGKNQTLYLDDIVLNANKSATQPTPTPGQSVTPTTVPPTPTPTQTVKLPTNRFKTLAPGSALPTSNDCSTRVARSSFEPRPENSIANQKKGIPDFPRIDGATPEGNALFKPRIDGNFSGTTDEIIQWGACKWGFDDDTVRAVAAQESWWRQSTLGDFNGSDYESYGLLQVRRTYHTGTYPYSQQSVPFNVDYALAWRRSCYEGYFNWVPTSAKGDEWGCVGLWFSGRWRDGDPNIAFSGANWYINKVQGYRESKPWLNSEF